MPMREQLQIPSERPFALENALSWMVRTIASPEFLMILLFSALGLWLTIYFVKFFPDFGAIAETLMTLS
jgi:hypothetical protein